MLLRSRSGLPLLVIAVVIAGLGFYFGNQASQSALGTAGATTAPLLADTKHLDFGESLARSNLELRIPIANVSESDVEVVDWDRSCGACTTVEPQTLMISAGETREVLVRLDLAPSRPATDLSRTREFNRSLGPLIRYADGSEYRGPPMEWSLTGRVRDFVSADPAVVVCKEESVRAPAFAPFSINLEYGVDVNAVTAACDPELATASIVQVDPTNWRVDVSPTAQPDGRLGEFRFAVDVTHTTDSGESLPPISIPVTGTRVSDVVADVLPSSVLGRHSVGTPVPFTVRLHSRTDSPFEAELVDDGVRVESIQREGAGITYALSREVEHKGLRNLDVTFRVKHGDGFEEESTARIFCVGVEPGVSGEQQITKD